jgi:hypothetical protein
VSAPVASYRRCYTLLLVCCAVVLLNVGCRSTDNTTNSGGVASHNSGWVPSYNSEGVASSKPASSWSLFAPEPKKIQSPSDFIAQPRPQ